MVTKENATASQAAGLSSAQRVKTTGLMFEPSIQRRKRPTTVSVTSNPLLQSSTSVQPMMDRLYPVTKILPRNCNAGKSSHSSNQVTVLKIGRHKSPTKRGKDLLSKLVPTKHKKELVELPGPKDQHIDNCHSSKDDRDNANLNKACDDHSHVTEDCNRKSRDETCGGDGDDEFDVDNNENKPLDNSFEKQGGSVRYQPDVVLSRPHKVTRRTEYQKKFSWKWSPKANPILAANEVVSNSDSQVVLYDDGTRSLSSCSEYRSQYIPWACKKVTRSVTADNNNNNNNNQDLTAEVVYKVQKDMSTAENNTLESVSPTKAVPQSPSRQEVKQIMESLDSPIKVDPSKNVKWLSEYGSNFQPFTKLCYKNGTRESDVPLVKRKLVLCKQKNEDEVYLTSSEHINPDISVASWFAEVKALREKAAEYRRRACGTHFASNHVGQLPAKEVKLWDDCSTSSSSIATLSLDGDQNVQLTCEKPVSNRLTLPKSSAEDTGQGLTDRCYTEPVKPELVEVEENGCMQNDDPKKLVEFRGTNMAKADVKLSEQEKENIPTQKFLVKANQRPRGQHKPKSVKTKAGRGGPLNNDLLNRANNLRK